MSSERAADTYKGTAAVKLGIPVVTVDFIFDCIKHGKLLNSDDYLVVGKNKTEEFSTGKIVGKTMHL